MAEYGFDEQPLFMAAGIRPEEIDQDDATLNFERCDPAGLYLPASCTRTGAWLETGLALNLPSHGILATAAIASRYIGEMLTMFVRYMGTRVSARGTVTGSKRRRCNSTIR